MRATEQQKTKDERDKLKNEERQSQRQRTMRMGIAGLGLLMLRIPQTLLEASGSNLGLLWTPSPGCDTQGLPNSADPFPKPRPRATPPCVCDECVRDGATTNMSLHRTAITKARDSQIS